MSEIRTDTINNASGDNDSGIDLSTNDQVVIKTANTTAVTIDSSQGVTLSSNGDATQLKIKRASASQDNGLSLLDQVDTAQAYFNLEGTATNNLQIASTAEIQFFSNSTLGNPPTNERMRIDSSGHLSVGKTSFSFDNTSGFSVAGSGGDEGQGHFIVSGTEALKINRKDSNGNGLAFFRGSTNNVGSITFNTSSVSYNTSSDARLKENVTADWDATTRLKQLNPVRFNFIADADTTVDGFLAHEVQSVVPEAITGTHNEVDDDGNPVYQSIDQSKIVPLLVKTIQELEARITALENA